MAVGQGQGPGLSPYALGQKGGSENITPAVSTMAAHTHVATAKARAQSGPPTTGDPTGAVWAFEPRDEYSTTAPNVDMLAGAVTVTNANTGGGQGMPIMQPYLALNWQVAIQGIYPSRN